MPLADTLLEPGKNCCAVARAERVAFLIDSEDYFRAFWHAAQRAERSILILGWDFDSRTRLHFDPVEPGDPPVILGEFLNYLVRRRRGLRIRVLDWDYPMLYGTDRELPPEYGLGWEPAKHVTLHYDDTHPFAGSQHQKVVVIDDAIAFSGGIDLAQRRWDRCGHQTKEPHREIDGTPYPPVHDLMIAVDGDAAHALGNLARARWHTATGERLRRCTPPKGDAWPEVLAVDVKGVEVGIARTFPATEDKPAVREVERLYLDMIAAAKRNIYIENQYFTSPAIAEALERRLQEPKGPNVLLVLRLLSHGWLEEHTMHVLRSRLLQRMRRADRHGRFRVCYPHVPGLPEGQCLDVHSKLMIVDDSLLRIGSSNLCNRSMGVDSECDILVEARGRRDVEAAIRGFRERLLGEHLACEQEDVRKACANGAPLCKIVDELCGREHTLKKLEENQEWPDAVLELAAVADPAEPITQGFFGPASKPAKSGPAWGKLAIIALIIAALAAAWRFTPLADLITPQKAIEWAKDFGGRPWAPYAVALAYTPACFVLFPRPLITLAAVIAFGPWLGFVIALSGVVFSAGVTYLAGMRMRRSTVRRLAGQKLTEMIEVLRKHGLLAMTLLRLVPIAPFAVEGIVAGAVRLKLWHLLVGTALGMLPGTLATTIFGDQLEAAFSEGRGINWWIIAGVAVLLVGGGFAVRRWFQRMAAGAGRAKRRSTTSGRTVAAQSG
jgi:phospholipase D1/2